jgi:hypothetical protein
VWDPGTDNPATEWRALVRPASETDNTDALDALLDYAIVPLLPEGIRGPDAGELVILDDLTGDWRIVNVIGRMPQIEGAMIAAGSIGEHSLGFTVAGGNQVTISDLPPDNPAVGDIWYDALNGYRMNYWQLADPGDPYSGHWVPKLWGVPSIDPNSTTRVFLSSQDPALDPANLVSPLDVWIQVTSDGTMQMFHWSDLGDGTLGWVPVLWSTEAIAAAEISAEQIIGGIVQGLVIIGGNIYGTIGYATLTWYVDEGTGQGSWQPTIPPTMTAPDGTEVDIPPVQILGSHVEGGSTLHLDFMGGNILVYSEPTAPPIMQQWLTPGSYSWPVPQGVTAVRVEVWGGGGGGGTTAGGTAQFGGGGAGGGEYARSESIPVSYPGQCGVIVGAGGLAGTRAGQTSTDGAPSRFVSTNPNPATNYPWTVEANGGTRGSGRNRGLGGTGSTAPVHYNGGNGIANTDLTFPGRGGGGGSSAGSNSPGNTPGGYGGAPAPTQAGAGGNGGLSDVAGSYNGVGGAGPGGGGGGNSSAGTTAGAGGAGRVRITYQSADAGPQLVASVAAVPGTDDHTGNPVPYPHGVRVQRPDLVGFVGGYYEEVNPQATVIASNPATGYILAPLTRRPGLAPLQYSDYRPPAAQTPDGSCFDLPNGYWYAPALGLYEFFAGVRFAAAPNAWVLNSAIALFIIGANSANRQTAFATTQVGQAYDGQVTAYGMRWCTAGERVQFNVRQNTGAAMTIDNLALGTIIAIRKVA